MVKAIKISWGIRPPGFSYETCFSMAKDAGFDGIDFLPSNKYFFVPPNDIIKFSQKYKIDVTGMHSPLHLVPYAPQFLFSRIVKLTSYFPNVKTYVVHMSMLLNYLQNNPKKIETLCKMGKEKGITICFESNPIMFPLQYYPKETYEPAAYGDFCVKHNLSMTLDTSHIASVGGDIVEFYKKYYRHIRMMHLSDFKDGKEHLPFGQGVLPLKKLFDEMKKTKQEHYIVFEIGNFPLAKHIQDKQKALKASTSMMKNYFALIHPPNPYISSSMSIHGSY